MWLKLIFLVLNFMTPIYCAPYNGSIQPSGNKVILPEENTNADPKIQTILDLITETAEKCDFPSSEIHSAISSSCNRSFPPLPNPNEFISDDLILCIGIYDAFGHLWQKMNMEHQKYKNTTTTGDQNSNVCKDIKKVLPDSSFEPTKEWKVNLHYFFGDDNVQKCEQACIHDKVRNPLCQTIFSINTISMNVGKQKMPVKIGKVSGETADPKQQPPEQVTGANNKENPNNFQDLKKHPLSVGIGVNKATSGDTFTESNKSFKVADTADASAIDATKPPVSVDDPSSMNGLIKDITTGLDTVESTFDETEQEQFPTDGETFQKEDPSPPMVQHTIPTNNSVTSTVREPVSTKKNDMVTMTQSNNKIEPPDQSGVPDVQVPVKPDNSTFSATLNMPPTTLPESDVTSKKGGVNKTIPDVNASKEDTEKLSEDKMEDLPNDESMNKLGTSSNNYDDAVPDSVQSQETQGNQDIVNDDIEMVPNENKAFVPSHFVNAEDSHFFAYFVTMMIFCVIAYLVFHNKQKILALALEGRSRRGTRRRPNTSGYRKLDSNLEEAVTSTCSTSVTHVIY